MSRVSDAGVVRANRAGKASGLAICRSALIFLVCSAGWAGSIALNPVWEKNLPEFNLVAPLTGAVALDGTICIARKQGQEAVLLGENGARIATLRGDPAGSFELVSVAAIGYEPTRDFFWIWSNVVHRLTRWQADGTFLGATRVAQEVDQLKIHGERWVYVRRPDQGSQHSIFSYFAEQDEEIMVWQPSSRSGRVVPDGEYVTFALGRHYLGVRDFKKLTFIHLDEWQEPYSVGLPSEWFPTTGTKVGAIEVQTQNDAKVHTPVLGDSRDRFWVFHSVPGGIGCRYVLFDAHEGIALANGILEDMPLMVDDGHLYFLDLEDANTQVLRKVAFSLR